MMLDRFGPVTLLTEAGDVALTTILAANRLTSNSNIPTADLLRVETSSESENDIAVAMSAEFLYDVKNEYTEAVKQDSVYMMNHTGLDCCAPSNKYL